MDQKTTYRGLNFSSHRTRVNARIIFILGTLVLFSLLWVIIPSAILYWLLIVPVGVVIWVASYGWRQAVGVLLDLLHFLERQ